MPNPLTSVACGDGYTDAATIRGVWGGAGGSYVIVNQPVFYKMYWGSLGLEEETGEAQLQPGGGVIPPGVTGVAFRNATKGQTATVTAYIAQGKQPFLSNSFAGATASTMITGIVAANGTITAGSGFTVTKGAAGIYTVNFTVAFSAAPVVLVEPTSGATTNSSVKNVTGSSCEVDMLVGTLLTDGPFNFLAQAVS